MQCVDLGGRRLIKKKNQLGNIDSLTSPEFLTLIETSSKLELNDMFRSFQKVKIQQNFWSL